MGGPRVPSSQGPGVPFPHLRPGGHSWSGRRPSGSLRDVQEGCSPAPPPGPCASPKPTARSLPHHPDLPRDPPPAASPPSKTLTPCGGRLPVGVGGGGAARVVRAVGGPSGVGGGRAVGRGAGVPAQGHTDTRRPRVGSGPASPLPPASLEQERLVSLSPPSLAETVCWKADRLLASSWHRGLGLNHK